MLPKNHAIEKKADFAKLINESKISFEYLERRGAVRGKA